MQTEDNITKFSLEHGQILMNIARSEIRNGAYCKPRPTLVIANLPPPLVTERASFVTLKLGEQLRGCIGSLEAFRPLARDVAENAYGAAFRDPRFPPVSADESKHLTIRLSILSRPEPVRFISEEDLRQKLRPGIDGLILTEGARRGTFLPAVWEDLPDRSEFLRRLKLKAGLPEDYWSDTLKLYRYTAETID